MNDSKQLTVIGCGLVGGSMCAALKRRRSDWNIVALDVDERIPSIVDADVADCVFSVNECPSYLAESGIVVLATPVQNILELLAIIAPHLQPGTVVSDVGSTKIRIVEQARRDLPDGVFFIGGHPIAGSERPGVAAADPLLFKGKPYLLCPDPATPGDALLALVDIVDDLSAVPVTLDAAEHDDMMAMVSHVPHLLAVALFHAALAEDETHGLLSSVAGRGFLDFTRIAASDYELWSSILDTNRESIDTALDSFESSLNAVRESMEKDTLSEIWTEVSSKRRRMNAESTTRVRKPDLRTQIDFWDEQLLKALGKRLDAVARLGRVKRDYDTPVYDADRERLMMLDRREMATSLGLPADLVDRLFETIVDYCRTRQAKAICEAGGR